MVTKPCRWRGTPGAGGSSGSCHGRQPRAACGSHPRRVQCLLCALGSCSGASLMLEHRARPEGPAPGTERGVGWEQGPSWCQHPVGHGCSWKGPSRAPGLHTQQGGLLGDPSSPGRSCLQEWHSSPAALGLLRGDSALPTLPLAVITCQQLL